MERYDYHEAVYNDVVDYICENIDFSDYDTIEDLADHLNDKLLICDSVTGNASGSYTFSSWEAQENICHNLDLLDKAVHEYGNAADLGRLLFKARKRVTSSFVVICSPALFLKRSKIWRMNSTRRTEAKMAKINEVVRGLLRYGHYITDETFDADGHSVRVRLIDCNGAIWYVSMLDGAVVTVAQV